MKIPFARSNVCAPLINVRGVHVTKYRSFKTLLEHNRAAMNAMAELEHLYHSGRPFGLASVKPLYETLLEAVHGVIHAMGSLGGSSPDPETLEKLVAGIDRSISEGLQADFTFASTDLVLPFDKITEDLLPLVGAKAANLARILNEVKLPVPGGFVVTAHAFQRVIEDNGLRDPIERALASISLDDMAATETICSKLMAMLRDAVIPGDIREAIARAYAGLQERMGRKGVRVAMRSSAVGEDTEATFAGQYTTVLNVDRENIIDAYKTVIASKYSSKAVSYRLRYGLADQATPMAVACVAMIDAAASGVMYTSDSTTGSRTVLRVSSLWGLAEPLVDGSTSPDSFFLDKGSRAVLRRDISRKQQRLTAPSTGGTRLEKVAETEQEMPSLEDGDIARLCEYGLRIENYFGSPQDIEWALDGRGNLFVLQSRPLRLPEKTGGESPVDLSGSTVLTSQGKTASPGVAVGRVFIVRHPGDIEAVPADSILVAKTASPEFARLAGKVRGIITDIGSAASHLASVAREFGIPLVVDAGDATTKLANGEEITLRADTATVYQGIVKDLLRYVRPARQHTFESPVHLKLKQVLDLISPLTLTDPNSASFSAVGCRTLHDVVRFTHERGVKAMFGITDEAREVRSIELNAKVPLALRLIDLGGGLSPGLTTCHVVTPGHIESAPLRALWRGFTHPGISWEGSMPVDTRRLLTLFAAAATSEVGETLAGTSYAIISGEYMNLSARFGYHFATVDALCGKDPNLNYISLQFAGGAGNYYGRSLRVSFLGSVLAHSGFQISIKGDLIEASLTGYDEASTADKLDQLGRLLASSRLLDMTISGQADVQRLTEAFLRGEYDFLIQKRDDAPRHFYTHGGYWRRVTLDGRDCCMQDGSRSGLKISSAVAGLAGRLMGQALQEFLDNIEAYFFFPLAIAKDSEVGDAMIRVLVKPVGGNIDRAGGIAFGIRDVNNYFVLRINALEDNVILFEYANGRRLQRALASQEIPSGLWQEVAVRIRGNSVEGFLDGRQVITYESEGRIRGFIGLWTKADSVTLFDRMKIETADGMRTMEW